MRKHTYSFIVSPSVDFLAGGERLLINIQGMAEFLQVPPQKVRQLSASGRIPLPVHLGLGSCSRWNVLELLEWVRAGCPIREEWIKINGWTGWWPLWRSDPFLRDI